MHNDNEAARVSVLLNNVLYIDSEVVRSKTNCKDIFQCNIVDVCVIG